MPTISPFYGIIIVMYLRNKEHNPPHIHAIYGDDAAAIDLNGEVLDGYITPKALALVREWISLHKSEIERIWKTQDFVEIEPLK